MAALDAVTQRYARRSKAVRILGLNDADGHLHERLTGRLSSH